MQPSRNDSDSPVAEASTEVPRPSIDAAPGPVLGSLARPGRAILVLALAMLAALPVWSYLATETALAARAIVVSVAALALASPGSALLACAGLLPLTGPLSALLGSTIGFTLGEPLVLACLAGCLLRSAVRPGPAPDAPVRAVIRPALVLEVVVAASVVVELLALQPAVAYPWPFAVAAFRFLYTDYFGDRGTFGTLVAGVLVLEGIGLFVVGVTLAGRTRALGSRLLAMVACGVAGVATLSVVRLLTVSLRTGDTWPALLGHIQTIRISTAFPDPNAAGSYLAMGLLLTLGLALASRARGHAAGRRRSRGWLALAWLHVVLVVAVALWLTGSRSALFAAVPASAVMLPLVSRVPRWLAWGGVAAAVLAAALLFPFAAGRLNPPDTSGRSISRAVTFRTEITQAAARMIADQPLFGVGIGKFYARSSEYFAPAFRATVPRENAHNNFLQVLAELGMVGFVPFLWTIGVVGAAVVRGGRSGRLPAEAFGGAAGLAAFILTWLTGHPLLIFEVATAFWLVLAAVAALAVGGATGPEAGRSTHDPVWRWAAAVIAVVAIASVPLRGHVAAQRANLKDAAIGLSVWQTDERGERFRRMTDATAQFYVPAKATSMNLPIRLGQDSPPDAAVSIELRLDGEVANRVWVQGTAWRGTAVLLPRIGPSDRYRMLQLSVVSGEPGASDRHEPAIEIGVPVLTESGKR